MNDLNKQRTVCVVSLSDISKDARVARYLEWLKDSWRVTLVAFTAYHDTRVRSILLGRPKRRLQKKVTETLLGKVVLRHYDDFYWSSFDFSAVEPLRAENFDLIIANDYTSLPLVFERLHASKIIYDAHEFTPEQYSDLRWRVTHRRYAVYLLEKYIHRADEITTVSEGVARAYDTHFGTRPKILTNAASYHDITPSSVKSDLIRIIHHGGAGRSRRIEEMIRVMKYIDRRFQLHLMLVGGDAPGYRQALYRQAARCENIVLHEPVAQNVVVSEISQYDIGLYMAPETSTNQRYMLPNKLFDFIQARLMVAIGPAVEMRRIVEGYGVGIVADDFRAPSMAHQLNRLSASEIMTFKTQSAKAALALSAEANKQNYLAMLDSLLA